MLVALLRGKVKPNYFPSIDTGDYIILLNADSILLNPDAKQHIVSNPGRPGHSLKIKNVSDCLPKFVIERAVKGMLPKSTLGAQMFRKLFVYEGAEHPHTAQKPQELVTEQLNSKN